MQNILTNILKKCFANSALISKKKITFVSLFIMTLDALFNNHKDDLIDVSFLVNYFVQSKVSEMKLQHLNIS